MLQASFPEDPRPMGWVNQEWVISKPVSINAWLSRASVGRVESHRLKHLSLSENGSMVFWPSCRTPHDTCSPPPIYIWSSFSVAKWRTPNVWSQIAILQPFHQIFIKCMVFGALCASGTYCHDGTDPIALSRVSDFLAA